MLLEVVADVDPLIVHWVIDWCGHGWRRQYRGGWVLLGLVDLVFIAIVIAVIDELLLEEGRWLVH